MHVQGCQYSHNNIACQVNFFILIDLQKDLALKFLNQEIFTLLYTN